MNPTLLAALAVAGLVAYALGRAVMDALGKAGSEKERADRAEADASTAKRQGQIMAQQKDLSDVEDDLRNGRF
ncbi:hypothetical protein [Methylocystis heyeri]|uniref:Uncharacterized protein n=1 Tax=Methylocystis heyeri TaxID=391905 RepID=A0A6B8KJG7_9HYPH|nr:hypothetical protein [Methylocystis heyeri]QGM46720.1 hypothetical protein H2LOC_014025 [Methylocystis heyeri]